jgi:hypothetical protein
VGAGWDKLSPQARAALISMAYNYGSLPKDVVAAAQTGDFAKIAGAVAAHQTDNAGVNQGRRLAEAQAIGGGVTVNRNVTVGTVTINTKATDAKGIAGDFSRELQRSTIANQVNTGLG